jgi:hypothetical protein
MFLNNKQKGGMDIADILYQIILPIVFFVFITVWNPLIALMNFSAMDYGTTIELLFRMLPLLILAVYVAVQIKKWKSDSLA